MDEVRIGILLYPGAQHSVALGLTDLFRIAGQMAARSNQDAPQMRMRALEPTADGGLDTEGADDTPFMS